MSIQEVCKNCCYRGTKSYPGGVAGCEFSGAMPIVTLPDQACVFLKRGEESRFKAKQSLMDTPGRLIAGYDVPSVPDLPSVRQIPEENSETYSIVCRQDRGSFRVDKNGNCFSDCDDMKPIGHISDYDEETPTEEEIRESILWLRNRIKEF